MISNKVWKFYNTPPPPGCRWVGLYSLKFIFDQFCPKICLKLLTKGIHIGIWMLSGQIMTQTFFWSLDGVNGSLDSPPFVRTRIRIFQHWKMKKWVKKWRFRFFTENSKMAPFWPKMVQNWPFWPKIPKNECFLHFFFRKLRIGIS